MQVEALRKAQSLMPSIWMIVCNLRILGKDTFKNQWNFLKKGKPVLSMKVGIDDRKNKISVSRQRGDDKIFP